MLTRGGAPLRFVEQGAKAAAFEDKYEVRIYLKGEVQVRAANWHDLLNALVWLTFPRAKAALNERHYHALEKAAGGGRAQSRSGAGRDDAVRRRRRDRCRKR